MQPKTSAALANVRVDVGDAAGVVDGVGAAFFRAPVAFPALVLYDMGLSGRVLLHLSGPAPAAHSDILDGTAESGLLVALEVGERDEDIRVHDGGAYQGRFAVFPVPNRDLDLVRPPEAVGDDDVTAGGDRVKSV